MAFYFTQLYGLYQFLIVCLFQKLCRKILVYKHTITVIKGFFLHTSHNFFNTPLLSIVIEFNYIPFDIGKLNKTFQTYKQLNIPLLFKRILSNELYTIIKVLQNLKV